MMDKSSIKGFTGEFRFLSNFYDCEVWYNGLKFFSSEAAYMSAKTLDIEQKNKFQEIKNPAEAKKLGKEIKIRDDWESIKYDTMAIIVFDKFYRNKNLREKLIATGSKYLEETNTWGDKTWGVCNGQGQNWLGKILMKTRRFWMEEDKHKPVNYNGKHEQLKMDIPD